MSPLVLNRPDSATTTLSASGDISKELKHRIDSLKIHFYDLESGGVDYEALRDSQAYGDYKGVAENLVSFDLKSLAQREAKLAFWINMYNALVVHGVTELKIKRSVKEITGFFRKVSYDIGGFIFSLDDMEHGILRGNKKKHLFSRKPLRNDDKRAQFALGSVDPRIHFALVCGSNSCPPIDVYDAEQIDAQLDLVSEAFINSEEVIIDRDKGQVRLSRIFKWYKEDFGGADGILAFIRRFRYDADEKAFINGTDRTLKFIYNPYDWSLNHA